MILFLSEKSPRTISLYGIFLSLIVLTLKMAAWLTTGSIVLQADALETIVNVIAAAGGLYALSIAALPPDINHTYGHQKAEYLSAIAESITVIGTAVLIFHEAWVGWSHPSVPYAPIKGMSLNFIATIINLIWGYCLITIGSKKESAALVATGQHIFTDVVTSFGIVIGFAVVILSGRNSLDCIISFIIGCQILYSGCNMTKKSIAGLMDEAPEPKILRSIHQAIASSSIGAIEAHDIRSRKAGHFLFVEFHLVVDDNMTVHDSHFICEQIETAIKKLYPESLISIHVEPSFFSGSQNAIFPLSKNQDPTL